MCRKNASKASHYKEEYVDGGKMWSVYRYVEHKNGGAYTALKYARKLGKKIINLATDETWNSDKNLLKKQIYKKKTVGVLICKYLCRFC